MCVVGLSFLFSLIKSWIMSQYASFAHIWCVSSQTAAQKIHYNYTTHTHTHTVTHSIRPLWGGQRCRLYGNDAVRWLSGRQQRRCHESWGEKNLKTLTKKRTEKPVNLDAESVYQTRSESKHPENGDIFSCDLVCQSRALQRKQHPSLSPTGANTVYFTS